MIRFASINIETYAYCNRKCDCCFHSVTTREQGIMDTALFEKIIDELGDLKFNKRVSLYLFGEPLLDERIIDFIKYVRLKAPQALPRLSSNGDYLTRDMCAELRRAGLNDLLVTNYDEEDKPDLRAWADKFSFIRYRHHTEIDKVARLNIMAKRDGHKLNCLRPIHQMVINWKGDVILCCQDFKGKTNFGNVRDTKLIDIWNSDKLVRVKAAMKLNKSKAPEMCRYCELVN